MFLSLFWIDWGFDWGWVSNIDHDDDAKVDLKIFKMLKKGKKKRKVREESPTLTVT